MIQYSHNGRGTPDNTMKRTVRKMTYEELKESVSGRSYRMTRYNVVSYLIGRIGVVTEKEWDMINRLYMEDIVTE